MKGYLKLSLTLFLGGCLPWVSLFGQPQAISKNQENSPAPSTPTPIDNQIPAAEPKIPSPSTLPPSPVPKAPSTTDRIPAILDFWFGFLPDPYFFPEHKMPIWFASTPEINHQIRHYFLQDMINAQRGKYNHWRETPRGRLALILLLDQFPRHVYRGKPQAFMMDQMARTLVLEGIRKGDDRQLYLIERAFFYLPLEHAENLEMQNLSISAYRRLLAESPEMMRPQMQDFLQSAIAHQQQIAQFGRFPHRNTILGRTSTPEETVFLMQTGQR